MAIMPGLLMRAVMYSPKDFAAGVVAFAAICAIVANAIFFQAGRHPAPLFSVPSFGAPTPVIANPLPRPRPIEATQPAEKSLDSRLFDNKPAEIRAPSKPEPRAEVRPEAKPEKPTARAADPMAGLIRNAAISRPAAAPPSAATMNVPRPPAPVPARGDPLGDLISGRGGR